MREPEVKSSMRNSNGARSVTRFAAKPALYFVFAASTLAAASGTSDSGKYFSLDLSLWKPQFANTF
jgi:hypothetical protein